MKKKIGRSFAVLFAILMIATILPFSAFADNPDPVDPEVPVVEEPVVEGPVVDPPVDPPLEPPAIEEEIVEEEVVEVVEPPAAKYAVSFVVGEETLQGTELEATEAFPQPPAGYEAYTWVAQGGATEYLYGVAWPTAVGESAWVLEGTEPEEEEEELAVMAAAAEEEVADVAAGEPVVDGYTYLRTTKITIKDNYHKGNYNPDQSIDVLVYRNDATGEEYIIVPEAGNTYFTYPGDYQIGWRNNNNLAQGTLFYPGEMMKLESPIFSTWAGELSLTACTITFKVADDCVAGGNLLARGAVEDVSFTDDAFVTLTWAHLGIVDPTPVPAAGWGPGSWDQTFVDPVTGDITYTYTFIQDAPDPEPLPIIITATGGQLTWTGSQLTWPDDYAGDTTGGLGWTVTSGTFDEGDSLLGLSASGVGTDIGTGYPVTFSGDAITVGSVPVTIETVDDVLKLVGNDKYDITLMPNTFAIVAPDYSDTEWGVVGKVGTSAYTGVNQTFSGYGVAYDYTGIDTSVFSITWNTTSGNPAGSTITRRNVGATAATPTPVIEDQTMTAAGLVGTYTITHITSQQDATSWFGAPTVANGSFAITAIPLTIGFTVPDEPWAVNGQANLRWIGYTYASFVGEDLTAAEATVLHTLPNTYISGGANAAAVWPAASAPPFTLTAGTAYSVWAADAQAAYGNYTIAYTNGDGAPITRATGAQASLIYDPNGHNVTVPASTGPYDEDENAPVNTGDLSYTGWDFLGWAHTPAGPVAYAVGETGLTYQFQPEDMDDGKILYAIWAANFDDLSADSHSSVYNGYNNTGAGGVGGTDKAITVNGLLTSDTVSYSWVGSGLADGESGSGLTEIPKFINAGVYTVTATVTRGDSEPEEVTATVTITQREVSLNSDEVRKDYNGQPQALSVTVYDDSQTTDTGLVLAHAVTGTKSTIATDVNWDPYPSFVGGYLLVPNWSITGISDTLLARNYVIRDTPSMGYIDPLEVMVTGAAGGHVYDTNAYPLPTPAYTLGGDALAAGHTLTGVGSWFVGGDQGLVSNTVTDPGSYTIAIGIDDVVIMDAATTRNYLITKDDGSYTVTMDGSVVAWEIIGGAGAGTYTGNYQNLVADDYEIRVYPTGSGAYKTYTASAGIAMNAAPGFIDVKRDPASYNTILSNDVDVLYSASSLVLADDTGRDVSAIFKAIQPTSQAGRYTVNPAPVSISVNGGYSKAADAADPAFSAKVKGALNGDRIGYSLSRAAGNTVGQTYAINISCTKTNYPNYKIALYPGTLAITDPGTTIIPTTTTTPTTPTTPTVPTVPIVPIVTLLPEPEPENIPEEPTPIADPGEEMIDPVILDDEEAPLARMGAWALLNLIIAILTVVFAVLLLITAFKRNKKKDETEEEQQARMAAQAANGEGPEEVERNKKSGMGWRILSIIAGIVAPIVFLLTEDIRLPMIFIDRWTLLMVIILVIQVISMILLRRARSQEEDEEEEQAQNA